MPTHRTIQLTCLILAADPHQRRELVQAAGNSAHTVRVSEASSNSKLREKLSRYNHDLVVIAPDELDDRLPACLLRYPDLPVLLVTPRRKTGPLDMWLQQGANDVVSYQHHDKFRHALERMLDECMVRAQLREATHQLASQQKLQHILLDTRAEALMLWQNGQVLESNACFASLIGCSSNDNLARGIEWKRWTSALSHTELHSPDRMTGGDIIITSTFGKEYRAKIEQLVLERGTAQLIRINPTPIERSSDRNDRIDSVTGLLLREYFVQALEHWLHSCIEQRYTIVQIHISEPGAFSGLNRTNSTLQELLAYRATNLLGQHFNKGTILGRTSPTTLTLVACAPERHSHSLAVRVRHCLASLESMVEDPINLHVKTLTLSPASLSASEVLDRLEQDQFVPRKTSNDLSRSFSISA